MLVVQLTVLVLQLSTYYFGLITLIIVSNCWKAKNLFIYNLMKHFTEKETDFFLMSMAIWVSAQGPLSREGSKMMGEKKSAPFFMCVRLKYHTRFGPFS